MAKELLRISRGLYSGLYFSKDPHYSYDEWGLLRVIPELARRLDPKVELLEQEIPKPVEESSGVTWLVGTSDENVAEAVKSIISHGSFSKAVDLGRDEQTQHFYDLLVTIRHLSPLSIACDTLVPGSYPKRAEPDDRPPLQGLYVLAEMDHHDKVLRYCEDHDEAFRIGDLAAAHLRGEERDDGQEQRAIFRWMSRLADITAISVQDFDGQTLFHLHRGDEFMPGVEDVEDGPQPAGIM